MSKKHVVFIINPKSGMERQKEISYAIDKHLDSKEFTHEVQFTQYAKHGTTLAAEAAAKGAYAVVAVGGDGSVNDIVHGLMNTETILAIIPKGSGNGMARTMQIPLDTEEAVKLINKGNVVKMDVGFANGRAFISNAGVAFDALISKKFAKSERRGFAIYSWLVTKHLWTYKVWNWNITIDGKELQKKAFMINVANGQQFGYNFKIAPQASFTDGMLDLVIVKKFPRILGGLIALRAMKGNITGSPYVESYTGKNITISHPSLKLMQTDGDAHACENKIAFSITPGAQKVLVP
jgi:YegS/Rv2252/BmrU family lipid kinase